MNLQETLLTFYTFDFFAIFFSFYKTLALKESTVLC